MKSDINPDVLLSEVFQLRDELIDLGEAVTDERLTTIILDALPKEIDSRIKMQSISNPELGLGNIIGMMKTIFINHSERSSVPKRSQESYRKNRDSSGHESKMNGRKSAMATVITCHNCKRPGHKKKDYKELIGKSYKPSNVEDGTRKWCSYHHSDGHSNNDCYQQQPESANSDNKKRWCSYHKNRSHLDAQYYHRSNGSCSSPAGSKVQ